MSRRDGITTEGLDLLIDSYKSNKDQEAALHKESVAIGDQIKDIMSKNNLDEFSTNNWTAKVSVTQKEDFNEDKAIDILKENLSDEDLKYVVRTREYIDDDALEKLVYAGMFDIANLQSCRTPGKSVVTLRISKKKK